MLKIDSLDIRLLEKTSLYKLKKYKAYCYQYMRSNNTQV